jgi:hypothetical protein
MNSRLNSSTLTDALPETWIEKLFDKMLLDYGKKFIDQWSGADTDKLIAHWSRELAGYSGLELKRGYDALATRDWPPSLPEFKKLCRPPVDSMHAYYQAMEGVVAREKGEKGNWSHPAIYWAAVRLAFDLKSLTYSQVRDRWEKALADEMGKGSWPDIPEASLALPAPGKADLSREKAAQLLKQLGASDVLKPKTDHKRWAKRIVKEAEKPTHGYSALQIRFAKEAQFDV